MIKKENPKNSGGKQAEPVISLIVPGSEFGNGGQGRSRTNQGAMEDIFSRRRGFQIPFWAAYRTSGSELTYRKRIRDEFGRRTRKWETVRVRHDPVDFVVGGLRLFGTGVDYRINKSVIQATDIGVFGSKDLLYFGAPMRKDPTDQIHGWNGVLSNGEIGEIKLDAGTAFESAYHDGFEFMLGGILPVREGMRDTNFLRQGFSLARFGMMWEGERKSVSGIKADISKAILLPGGEIELSHPSGAMVLVRGAERDSDQPPLVGIERMRLSGKWESGERFIGLSLGLLGGVGREGNIQGIHLGFQASRQWERSTTSGELIMTISRRMAVPYYTGESGSGEVTVDALQREGWVGTLLLPMGTGFAMGQARSDQARQQAEA